MAEGLKLVNEIWHRAQRRVDFKASAPAYASIAVTIDILSDPKNKDLLEMVKVYCGEVAGTVTCDNCGFRYGAEHTDPDGSYSCPVCEADKLREALQGLPGRNGL